MHRDDSKPNDRSSEPRRASHKRDVDDEPKLDEGRRLAGRRAHAREPDPRPSADASQGRYGYGGFGHMGQSDIDRRGEPVHGDHGVVGNGRFVDRYTSERYMSERYLPDRYPSERYLGMDHGQRLHPMRGKGPKNYVRSDERIREDACELLAAADLDASEIDVTVRDGEVMLEGTVEDRSAKRRAEDVVARARGVKDVHNHLRLAR
ncbi:MAG TPA: BON domain-containing protein [Nannocystaceae bacterium]|nr:BON domain-containing protein [Nannocystaceae bacterium]